MLPLSRREWLTRTGTGLGMLGLAGVLADAINANQVLLSNPARPDSARVGTSGALGSRVGLAAASSRTLPSRTIGKVVEGDANIDCTSPVTRASTAGIEPG